MDTQTTLLMPLRVEDGNGRWGGYTFLKDAAGNPIASTSSPERRDSILQFVTDMNTMWENTARDRMKAEVVDALVLRGLDPEGAAKRDELASIIPFVVAAPNQVCRCGNPAVLVCQSGPRLACCRMERCMAHALTAETERDGFLVPPCGEDGCVGICGGTCSQ